ncbi:MAG TPA: hypothetical protein VF607_07970 [Verrucomicrobiae bacterium]
MVRKIKLEERIAYFAYEGCVEIRDLETFIGWLEEFEAELPYSPDRFSDLSQVTRFELSYTSLDLFAQTRGPGILKNPVRSAIVAPQPLHFGYTRMYATIMQDPRVTIQIFADAADALAWLQAAPARS